jgi:hypothetical protein
MAPEHTTTDHSNMEVIFTQLAAIFPVKNLSLMHRAKFTIWISHPMKIYKLQHILSLSFNI